MKAFKCEMCKKYVDGSVDYTLSILDRFMDERDGSPTKEYDICNKCIKELELKLKNESDEK